MQSFFFNDENAGIRVARRLNNIQAFTGNTIDFSEDVLKTAEKLAYHIFDYLSENYDNQEARYNKALILSNQIDHIDEAQDIWDSMIFESVNGTIDFKNLFPTIISRYNSELTEQIKQDL